MSETPNNPPPQPRKPSDEASDPPRTRGRYKPRQNQPIDRLLGTVDYHDVERGAVERAGVNRPTKTNRGPVATGQSVRIIGAELCGDRDARVRYVADLVATGAWRTAHTRALADIWGITPYRVNSLVTEAHRIIREGIGDRERVRLNVVTFLENIAHEAASNGDRRSAVSAMRAISDIAGLVTHRHEHTGVDGQPIAVALQAVRQLTNEELEAEIVRAGAARVSAVAADEARELTDAERAIVDANRLLPVISATQ